MSDRVMAVCILVLGCAMLVSQRGLTTNIAGFILLAFGVLIAMVRT